MPYQFESFAQAKTDLAARLYDPGKVYWTDTELGLYILEALRTWQALTAFWINEFSFTFNPGTGTIWQSIPALLGNLPGNPPSPRVRTVQNVDLYTIVLYQLLEQQLAADGVTWQGTVQFTLTDLTQALERRQNETITIAGSSLQLPPPTFVLTPNTRYISLPDTILDVRRAKWLPANPPLPAVQIPNQVLWRGDLASFSYFTAGYLQSRTNPRNYAISNVPPLNLEVDFPPQIPGSLELLATQSRQIPAPPGKQVLAVPDDWSWVVKWGMLMDLLNKQSEARDEQRALYCKARYMEGLDLFRNSPAIVAANIENVPVGIESVIERDTYDAGWEASASARVGIVTASLDTFTVTPKTLPNHPNGIGVVLSLAQNAPIPTGPTDNVQVTRDTLDVIIDYATHLAMFKCGGAEFQSTMDLFDNFRKAAMLANKRIANLGLFDDIMKRESRRQGEVDPRYTKDTSASAS